MTDERSNERRRRRRRPLQLCLLLRGMTLALNDSADQLQLMWLIAATDRTPTATAMYATC